MWGLVFSAATIAISVLTGTDDKASTSVRHSSAEGRLMLSPTYRIFLSGALLGTGLSLLCSSLSQQFGISERCKAIWQSWWNWETTSDAPFRIPTSYKDCPTLSPSKHFSSSTSDSETSRSTSPTEQQALLAKALSFAQNNDDGTIQILLSPKNAATWRLNVSLLRLYPGREMPSQKAQAVEFYYVVAGSGYFSQQGVNETGSIHVGDCFIVDPGNMRWISNRTGTEDLVLLRATDGANRYYGPSTGGAMGSLLDSIRMDPNRRATAMDTLRNSFQQVKGIAKDYYVKGVGGKSVTK